MFWVVLYGRGEGGTRRGERRRVQKARSRVRYARSRLAHQKICIVQFCDSDKGGIEVS